MNPQAYAPMLATPWPAPFVDDDWAFEVKWDGIRGLVIVTSGGVRVVSRAGNDLTSQYGELTALDPGRPVVLDGEIVAFDDTGRPSFELLQQRRGASGSTASSVVPISYAGFDILYDDGDVTGEPWDERRARLEALELPPPFEISRVIPADPTALWAFVEDRGIEGIVAKRRSSRYRPGERSPDWRKITRFRQVRAIVAGYLPGEGGRATSFGSLLLGLVAPEGLRWIGSVGSGFSDQALGAIRTALDQMVTVDSPFVDTEGVPRGAVWVEPHLVALVQFKEFTAAGRLRAPSFKGFTGGSIESASWALEGPGER